MNVRAALEWRADALCQKHPHLPWRCEMPLGDARRWMNLVCALCPVREQCLAEALTEPELEGVWAGTSQRQRIELREGRPIRIYLPVVKPTRERSPKRTAVTLGTTKVCARCGIAKDRVTGFGLAPNGYTRSPCKACAAAEAMAKRDAARTPKYRWAARS